MNRANQALIDELFALTGAASFLGVHRRYMVDDQMLMQSGGWDYDNPKLLINRIRSLLEQIVPDNLSAREKIWYYETLWIWHHHAISCAFGKRDRAAAKRHAARALELQRGDHPNKITRLLWLLAHEQIEEANMWVAAIEDPVEKETGQYLVCEYVKSRCFDD